MNKQNMSKTKSPIHSVLSLALLLPFPSLGIFFGMILFPNTILGKLLFLSTKVWVLLLPLLYMIFVEKIRIFSFFESSFIKKDDSGKRVLIKDIFKGSALGVFSGMMISIFIVLSFYFLNTYLLDKESIIMIAKKVGLHKPVVFIAGAIYWTFINSLLEEYVWRWFVYKRFNSLFHDVSSIILTGIGFTVHHIIAMSLYFRPPLIILSSTAIFVGSIIWSICYRKYETLFPAYISHALVDLAIYGIGFYLIFL